MTPAVPATAIAAPPSGGADADPPPAVDLDPYLQDLGDRRWGLDLMVEGLHCAGCVRSIETALARAPDVRAGRVNMTTRRLRLEWEGVAARGAELIAAVGALGYRLVPFDSRRLDDADRAEERTLLRALAVAGFAAANVMLLSVAVWAGHSQGMGPATRALMHWVSALVALPVIVYAGRPFFRSALGALAAGRANMDLPISLAVILAGAMSLFETATGGAHVYFDSALALLFFLLIGRYLDRRARGRARSAAAALVALTDRAVTVIDPDGGTRYLRPDRLAVGMTVQVAAGERIGADGRILSGVSEIDASLLTGETLPQPATPGDRVFAGSLNLAAPLRLSVTAVGGETLLAEIVRLMETAEQGRARYVALADRVAALYAPVVHGLAAITFVGWLLFGGLPWQAALLNAVAVLIITCPCALALAVPVVQVVASGRLMRRGVLVKSATALERLARIDHVALDKTGTLTQGRPTPRFPAAADPAALDLAAGMARASRHPLARAVARARPGAPAPDGVRETPGAGLALATEAGEVRLGSRAWCGVDPAVDDIGDPAPEMWLARPGAGPLRITFDDPPRADAAATVAALRRRGAGVEILSGDRAPVVEGLAAAVGIETWRAGLTPAEKCARLEALAAEGRRVLMVGDGLNDAPALAAASASMSPSAAADISQTAADIVFQGDRLGPVVEALDLARRSDRVVKQNFALAFLYNGLTIPLAVAGFVTPLVAAIAMSASSLAVILNALRVGRGGARDRAEETTDDLAAGAAAAATGKEAATPCTGSCT